MDTLSSKVAEAKAVLWGIDLYKGALDFIIGAILGGIINEIFGVTYASLPVLGSLITLISGIPVVGPAIAFLIPAAPFGALYAILQLLRARSHRNLVRMLEGKYDRLDERLETALEYKGARNIIVEDLTLDVARRMDAVEASAFFNMGDLSKRVWTVIIFCFLFLTLTVLNLRSATFDSINHLLDSASLRDTVDKMLGGNGTSGFDRFTGQRWEESNYSNDKDKNKLGAQSGGKQPGINEGPLPGTGSGTGADAKNDIFGKASSASIAGKDVDFRLHPEYGGEIEIRQTGGGNQPNQFNLDQVASVDECQDCVVGPENEEVVRRYFEKILPES
jgi:hypothetical protein